MITLLVSFITFKRFLGVLLIMNIAFVYLGDFSFIKYGHSSNASTVQGHFIPSLLILYIVVFCLLGSAGLFRVILVTLLLGNFFYWLVVHLSFNQFIYLGRISWLLTFWCLVEFSLHRHNFTVISPVRRFVVDASLFTLGSYFIYVMIFL